VDADSLPKLVVSNPTDPYLQLGLLKSNAGRKQILLETLLVNCPRSKPALFLHTVALGRRKVRCGRLRSSFTIERYLIIKRCDQRGCGRSLPSSSTPSTRSSVRHHSDGHCRH
jgi:hypothetical protein